MAILPFTQGMPRVFLKTSPYCSPSRRQFLTECTFGGKSCLFQLRRQARLFCDHAVQLLHGFLREPLSRQVVRIIVLRIAAKIQALFFYWFLALARFLIQSTFWKTVAGTMSLYIARKVLASLKRKLVVRGIVRACLILPMFHRDTYNIIPARRFFLRAWWGATRRPKGIER